MNRLPALFLCVRIFVTFVSVNILKTFNHYNFLHWKDMFYVVSISNTVCIL
jgi:uncharacterized membrane protein